MTIPLQESIPFAVIGSNTVVEAKGRRVRGRLYPWGIVEGNITRTRPCGDGGTSCSFSTIWSPCGCIWGPLTPAFPPTPSVENPSHCDFVKLRTMLVRTHMQDLKDVTRETHYENYRTQCIQSMTRMVVKERNRKYGPGSRAGLWEGWGTPSSPWLVHGTPCHGGWPRLGGWRGDGNPVFMGFGGGAEQAAGARALPSLPDRWCLHALQHPKIWVPNGLAGCGDSAGDLVLSFGQSLVMAMGALSLSLHVHWEKEAALGAAAVLLRLLRRLSWGWAHPPCHHRCTPCPSIKCLLVPNAVLVLLCLARAVHKSTGGELLGRPCSHPPIAQIGSWLPLVQHRWEDAVPSYWGHPTHLGKARTPCATVTKHPPPAGKWSMGMGAPGTAQLSLILRHTEQSASSWGEASSGRSH